MNSPEDRLDDELLARLRAADPASDLPPADPARVTQLMEAAMSHTDELTHESRETGTHDRSPLTWIVAAAAVVIVAGAGFFALSQRGHDASTPVARATVTELSVAPAVGKCIPLNRQVLEAQTIAFRGTLTQRADGELTFTVDHWFKGGPTDKAVVTGTSSALAPLVSSAKFSVGGSYLVSAHDGQVSACGFSGPATGRLAQLYAQAYGG